MLTGIHISHVFVTDQDEALDFYVGKLGLEVKDDVDRRGPGARVDREGRR